MAEPKVGPELARLGKDVGDWDGVISVTPAPGAPAQESKGRLNGKLISGGKWLILDFKNHTTGFEGHGIYGFDPAKKRYVGTWVDDVRGTIDVAEGDWDDDTRTLTYHWSTTLPNGSKMSWTETSQKVSDSEQVFRVFFPQPDGSPFEMMRAVYKKA
ncbi:MAG: DUF1579 family protein [Vicinamibacteria bacterium]